MSKFILDKQTARLIVLQRIELLSTFQRKLRKFFGRYLFVNFFSKYIFNCNTIGSKYFEIMQQEFESVQKEIQHSNKKYLSIGGGLGGFELIINQNKKEHYIPLKAYRLNYNYVDVSLNQIWEKSIIYKF